MKRLIIVRHGETEWSVSGQHTGRTDIPLTVGGEAAARRLGNLLKALDLEPVKVLSSPRQRAITTARLAGLGDHLEVTDLLEELDYGEYEGRTTADIRRERPDWDLFRDACPKGETLETAGERADRLLAELAPDEGAGDIALVGHGHFSRILGARYIGLPPQDARYLALSTASISVLGHEHEWRTITIWNHASGSASGSSAEASSRSGGAPTRASGSSAEASSRSGGAPTRASGSSAEASSRSGGAPTRASGSSAEASSRSGGAPTPPAPH